MAPTLERLGRRWLPRLGGALFVEAQKQVYAGTPARRLAFRPRLVPVPNLGPAIAGRQPSMRKTGRPFLNSSKNAQIELAFPGGWKPSLGRGSVNIATILEGRADPLSISPGASIRSAAEIMASNRIGFLLILNDDGSLYGVVSERDIVRDVSAGGEGFGTRTVLRNCDDFGTDMQSFGRRACRVRSNDGRKISSYAGRTGRQN